MTSSKPNARSSSRSGTTPAKKAAAKKTAAKPAASKPAAKKAAVSKPATKKSASDGTNRGATATTRARVKAAQQRTSTRKGKSKVTESALTAELDGLVDDYEHYDEDLSESFVQQIDALGPREEELRRANQRLFRSLQRAKTKTLDLVDAVYHAAHDAALTMGPPPPVPAPKPDRRKRDAEMALIHATDWQYGKVSESYSMEVCERRIRQFTDKITKLTNIQRAAHPVREAHVLFGGDMVEGTTIFPGQVYEIEATLYEQLFGVSRLMEDFIRRLLTTFQTVHVWEEYGNHGRLGRKGEQPGEDNVDRMAYRITMEKFTNEKRVIWHPSTSWHQIVEIGNYRALLVHGDEIKSFGGNCVTPDVRVLTRDLQWVPAGELQVGDKLLAFDEHGSPGRYYSDAEVTATGIHERDVWKITFDDGTSVRCTPEHPWIVSQTDRDRGGTNRQVWMTPPQIAERLQSGGRSGDGAGVWMFQPVRPWDNDVRDYDAGFLAGAFDADGCLSKGPAHPRWPIAEFAQYDNALLAAVKQALEAKGFIYKERTKSAPNGKQDRIHNLELAGRDETLRFLGQVRPPRLMDWWMNNVDVNALTFTRKSTSGIKRIIACAPDGVADICALTSSSATYITEFGPAHNTPAFGILRKCNSWATGVLDPFDDVYMGHFHTPMSLTMANAGRIFVSGSPESDNHYAKEFMAATGQPSQRLHFIDPERGRVTSEYTAWLD